MSCESTDILADNTDEATHPWCGDVRGNIMNTHMDTCGGDSHSRYRDDCLPESFFDGHKINYDKTECDKNTKYYMYEYVQISLLIVNSNITNFVPVID